MQNNEQVDRKRIPSRSFFIPHSAFFILISSFDGESVPFSSPSEPLDGASSLLDGQFSALDGLHEPFDDVFAQVFQRTVPFVEESVSIQDAGAETDPDRESLAGRTPRAFQHSAQGCRVCEATLGNTSPINTVNPLEISAKVF